VAGVTAFSFKKEGTSKKTGEHSVRYTWILFIKNQISSFTFNRIFVRVG